MCRNIKTLFNFDPPVTPEEVRAASLQFVRKITGINKPSKVNEVLFLAAVDDVPGSPCVCLNRWKRARRRKIESKRLPKPGLAPLRDLVPRHPANKSRRTLSRAGSLYLLLRGSSSGCRCRFLGRYPCWNRLCSRCRFHRGGRIRAQSGIVHRPLSRRRGHHGRGRYRCLNSGGNAATCWS